MGILHRKSKEETEREIFESMKKMLKSLLGIKITVKAQDLSDGIFDSFDNRKITYEELHKYLDLLKEWEEEVRDLCDLAVDGIQSLQEVDERFKESEDFYKKAVSRAKTRIDEILQLVP